MTENSSRRFFLCTGKVVQYKDLLKYPNSHVIGELRTVADEGRKVTALAIYMKPTATDRVPKNRPETMMNIIGDARNIRCRFEGCGNSQRWEIGRAAILTLMGKPGLQEKGGKI